MHRMATQKRRIVYFSDEEWEGIRSLAKASHMSLSAYIRTCTTTGITLEIEDSTGHTTLTIKPPPPGGAVMTVKSRQAQRDAILRKVNRGEK